jgi:E-phenylitaconyl-CoA hydratase
MSIDIDRQGSTLILTINRPEALNALDIEAMISLHRALREFAADDSLTVAIITGAGDRAFCTGADLKNTPPPAGRFAESYFAGYEASITEGMYVRAITLSELGINKPLIAAVNGHALGAGTEIALDCHLRIASHSATFGLPEARWASVPALGGVSHLLRAVPPAVAMKMILTGDRIDAAEAHRIGLVSDVVDPGELLDHALRIAERINRNGPLAIRSLVTLATRTTELPLRESIALEQLLWGVLRDTRDRVEGRAAFTERRTPSYHGH